MFWGNLSKISPRYEQRPFTSSWIPPFFPNSNDRKDVEADEEQQTTENTINFKKSVKLYIITSKKTNKKNPNTHTIQQEKKPSSFLLLQEKSLYCFSSDKHFLVDLY